MLFKQLLLVVWLLLVFPAKAGGFITEIGGGVMEPSKSSYLMTPECIKAVVVEPGWPLNPRADGRYSCGGDDPLFVGWPIAYEFNNGVRFGWFHYSHWFDNKGETQFNCLCASGTIRWSNVGARFKKWRDK